MIRICIIGRSTGLDLAIILMIVKLGGNLNAKRTLILGLDSKIFDKYKLMRLTVLLVKSIFVLCRNRKKILASFCVTIINDFHTKTRLSVIQKQVHQKGNHTNCEVGFKKREIFENHTLFKIPPQRKSLWSVSITWYYSLSRIGERSTPLSTHRYARV